LTPISLSDSISKSSLAFQGKESSDTVEIRKPTEFCGIEAVALRSRNREKATASQVWVEDSVSDKESVTLANSIAATRSLGLMKSTEKRLKWHAVIDTGMGRIGFKPELPTSSMERRDTAEIIQELIHAQFHQEAPIGKCFLWFNSSIGKVSIFSPSRLTHVYRTYTLFGSKLQRVLRHVHSYGRCQFEFFLYS
jgi:hypothetical protein